MKPVNDTRSYGWVSRTFHWSIAALTATAIGLGLYANSLPHSNQSELQVVFEAFSIHKTIGIVALFLALARIFWAIGQIKPRPLHPERRLETWAAEVVHWGLYAGMVVMPLSGWLLHASAPGAFSRIIWPFGQRLPGVPESLDLSHAFAAFHETGWWVLAGLIVLHVGGALKHLVIDRDVTVARMAGNPDRVPEPPVHHHRASAILAGLCGLLIWVGIAILSQYLPGDEIDPVQSSQQQPETAGTTETQATAQAAVTPSPDADAAANTQASTQPGTTATTAAAATMNSWAVESGNLKISVNQGGSAVDGALANWQAQIDFDPDSRTGTVAVTIDTASLTLGAVSDNAKGPEFLNAAAFPEARLTAEIAPGDGTELVAAGELTIAGQAVPISMPFDLVIDGDQAVANGGLTIDRRDFGVGKTYADESTVGFAVQINFDLTASRQ